MEKDIQKLTQEERLDLTDKQVREEKLAYTISAIENTLGILSTRQTIEDLKAENQRLKEQLDREIKINRKMKRALEKYADNMNWCVDRYSNKYKKWARCEDGFKLAKQVLKEIDNKE